MTIHKYLLLLIFFLPASLRGQDLLASKTTVEQIKEYLLLNQEWVPYPDYHDRAAWDKLLGENRAACIARGEKKLDYQWQPVVATAYLEYERSGERNIMQTPDKANTDALSDLLLAELAEGKGRFLDKIVDGVFFQCERTSWVLSAHLPNQLSGRTIPDHTDQFIDLASGDIGGMLAWAYYFFHEEFDKVNPILSRRLRDEIYEKIIIPYRTEDRFWWMGYKLQDVGVVNNWNPWCNCNVLQCMMLLENDPEQLSRDIYRTMLSVDKFINYVKKDGACEEGPSYWGHAAGKLYDYLQLLSWVTDGKVSLFDNKQIRDMGEYISRSYVGNDWVVNFADASARFSSDAGLIYRYGKALGSEEMMNFGAYLVANGKPSLTRGRDFFRALESLAHDSSLRMAETSHMPPRVTVYPETQFYYVNNKQGFFMAVKGGYNEESHNHNDAGTVSLYYKGVPILIDAGVGTYTRQTFGPERYSIWTMRSSFHNLPSINGFEQKNGRAYKATDVKFNEKTNTFSANLATAYPADASINYWKRSYRLESSRLVMEDNFSLQQIIQANEIHFMLWGKIDTRVNGEVSIEVQGQRMKLTYDKNLFEASVETIGLDDTRLSSVWGNEIYRLTLKAKNTALKSSYKFGIQPVQ